MRTGTYLKTGLVLGVSGLVAGLLFCGCSRDIDSEYADVEAGLTMLRQGKYRSAAKLLRKGVKKHPDSPTAQCNLGISYWFLERPEQAVEPLRAAAELAPYDSRPLEFLGLVFIDMERWDDARAAVEAALARPPRSPRVLTLMGLVEFLAGDTARAEGSFKQALALKRDYPPALYNMAVVTRDTGGDPQQAYEYFDKYLRTMGMREEGPGRGMMRVDTARAFVSAMDKEVEVFEPPVVQGVAVDQAEVAVEEPETVQQAEPEAELDPVIVKAREALGDDDIARALITLRQGIKEHPENPDLLWELAQIYDGSLGYADKAEEVYALFKERFPRDSRLGPASEAVAVDAGEPESEAGGGQDPGAARRAFAEGITLHRANDLRGAIVNYRRAVELDSSFIDAAYNLGLAYKEYGEFDLAKESFLRVLKLNPRLIRANYMLGVLCWDLNDNAEAIVHLNRTLEIKPDYAKAHYLLGVIHRKEARHDMAAYHFRRCVELEPDEEWSDKARKWLKTHAGR